MSTVEQSTTAVATRPMREIRVVQDDGPNSYLFDTARFEHMHRIAKAMALASLIPDHLKSRSPEETAANCFLIVNQAVRWGMDPFSVAPETYSVRGKLGFQGKLIAAVVNARANLISRLSYSFSGKGDDLTITVVGQFENEDQPRSITLSVRQGKTSNEMWTKDPEQKLVYSGATKWARRHCPEIILGVLTDDDIDRIADSNAAKHGFNKLSTASPLNDLIAGPESQAAIEAEYTEPEQKPAKAAKQDPLAGLKDLLSACESEKEVNDVENRYRESVTDVKALTSLRKQCDARRKAFEGTEQADDPLAGFEDALDACTSLEEVKDVYSKFKSRLVNPEQITFVLNKCYEREAVLKAKK